jgi:hypothetical protein
MYVLVVYRNSITISFKTLRLVYNIKNQIPDYIQSTTMDTPASTSTSPKNKSKDDTGTRSQVEQVSTPTPKPSVVKTSRSKKAKIKIVVSKKSKAKTLSKKKKTKPVVSEQPKEETKPVVSEQPKEETKPVVSEQPKEEAKPVVSEKPKKKAKPVVSEKPKKKAKPVVSEQPKEETKPVVSEKTKKKTKLVVSEQSKKKAKPSTKTNKKRSCPEVAIPQKQNKKPKQELGGTLKEPTCPMNDPCVVTASTVKELYATIHTSTDKIHFQPEAIQLIMEEASQFVRGLFVEIYNGLANKTDTVRPWHVSHALDVWTENGHSSMDYLSVTRKEHSRLFLTCNIGTEIRVVNTSDEVKSICAKFKTQSLMHIAKSVGHSGILRVTLDFVKFALHEFLYRLTSQCDKIRTIRKQKKLVLSVVKYVLGHHSEPEVAETATSALHNDDGGQTEPSDQLAAAPKKNVGVVSTGFIKKLYNNTNESDSVLCVRSNAKELCVKKAVAFVKHLFMEIHTMRGGKTTTITPVHVQQALDLWTLKAKPLMGYRSATRKEHSDFFIMCKISPIKIQSAAVEDDSEPCLEFNLDDDALLLCERIKKNQMQQIAKHVSRSQIPKKTYLTTKVALYIFLERLLSQSYLVCNDRKTNVLAMNDVLYVLGENHDQEQCVVLGE